MTQELQDLIASHELLDNTATELTRGPIAFFAMVLHARDHVNREINTYLRREEPALHYEDGEGVEIKNGPITTDEACRSGVALFE
jgi:hypothetical protein